MAILKFLKKMFGKTQLEPSFEYIHDEPVISDAEAFRSDSSADMSAEMVDEIDLSRQVDLEDYARDINVSKESIERWISSGLLMPEELKVAEKLVKIMRRD